MATHCYAAVAQEGHARLSVMVWEWRQVVVRRKKGEEASRADEV